MTKQIDWRSQSDYVYLDRLLPSELAWEFLRRNPDYRADYMAARRRRTTLIQPRIARWGLRFPANPALPAGDTDVIWQIAEDPSTLILTAIPPHIDGRDRRFQFDGVYAASEGHYGYFGGSGQRRNALLLPGSSGGCLAAVLPFSDLLPARGRAVVTLHNAVRLSSGRKHYPFSSLQRKRFVQMLRALDGKLGGIASHQIADQLYGSSVVPAREWKSHADRSRVRRLIADATKLSHGGYRTLLTL